MTPTQEHLLKLLGEIDDICVRNDIEYFIDFGTMLASFPGMTMQILH